MPRTDGWTRPSPRIEKGDHARQRVLVKRPGRSATAGSGSCKNLPDAPESRYLYALLAGHDFQEGLKNYRDLVYLGGTLDRWDDSMVAFQDMIETREKAYAERLPRADALLASDAGRQAAAARPGARGPAAHHRSAATTWRRSAPTTEREQWARIQRIESAL